MSAVMNVGVHTIEKTTRTLAATGTLGGGAVITVAVTGFLGELPFLTAGLGCDIQLVDSTQGYR